MRLIRTLLALTVPPLLGIVLLVLCAPFGRRRALSLAIPVVADVGLLLADVKVRIIDAEQYAKTRPAVFIFNHQSALDPMLAAALLRRDVVAIARKSLQHSWLIGPLLRLAGTLFVDLRQRRGVESLAPLIPALQQGYAAALAPEGTRSRDGVLGEFRDGARWLAAQAKVPLIPVVIHGSGQCLPATGKLIRAGTVTLQILPPMEAHETNNAQLEQLYRDCLAAADADLGGRQR